MSWWPIPLANGNLQGDVKFRAASNQPLKVRLTVRDLAGNQSYSEDEVAGAITAVGFTNPGRPPLPPNLKANPNDATPIVPVEPIAIPRQGTDPKIPSLPAPPGLTEHKVQSSPSVGLVPPIPPPSTPVAPPVVAPIPSDKIIADSMQPPPQPPVEKRDVAVQPLGGVPPNPFDVKPAVQPQKALAPLHYVNKHQVLLQYEVKRVGPSGVGGMEVWLTKDDGASWEPYAEVRDNNIEALQGRQERNFEFRDKDDKGFPDGVYGLALVVKNRAGLGHTPRPGDTPHMRIEIDTKPPLAQLYKPVPDAHHPDHVLLKWFVSDKNLTDTPINLEYAEKSDGPWQPIQLDLENKGRHTSKEISGDFSWKVPAGFPVQVYLRLRVRDKAGNESIAVSRQPEYLDLTEPVGEITGVQSK